MTTPPEANLTSCDSSLPQQRLEYELGSFATQVQDIRPRQQKSTAKSSGDLNAATATTPAVRTASTVSALQVIQQGGLNSRSGAKLESSDGAAQAIKRRVDYSSGNDSPASKRARTDHTASSQLSSRIGEYEAPRSIIEDMNSPYVKHASTPQQVSNGTSNSSTEQLRSGALRKLRNIWHDEHYGIPEKWRVMSIDVKIALPYLNLCQQAKEQGLPLAWLWVTEPCYLEKACRSEGKLSFASIEKASLNMRRAKVLPRPPQSGTRKTDSCTETLPARSGTLAANAAKESVNHKPIPRRQTHVSKEQMHILDSSHSHYPPFPGQDVRPGSIPLKLLHNFTTEANESALSRTLEAQRPLSPSQQPVDVAKPTQNCEDNHELLSMSDSTQEISASQWPPSPELPQQPVINSLEEPTSSRPPSLSPVQRSRQKPNHIPADSSPVDKCPSTVSDIAQSTSDEDSSASASLNGDDPVVSNKKAEECQSEDRGRKTNLQAPGRTIPALGSPEAGSESLSPVPSTSSSRGVNNATAGRQSSEQLHFSAQSAVEVTRTPFVGRRGLTEASRKIVIKGASSNVSEVVDSTFVPSTYIETTNCNRTESGQIQPERPRTTTSFRAPASPSKQLRLPGNKEPTRPLGVHQASSPRDFSNGAVASHLQAAREYRRSVLRPISKPVPTQSQGVGAFEHSAKDPPSAPISQTSNEAGPSEDDASSVKRTLPTPTTSPLTNPHLISMNHNERADRILDTIASSNPALSGTFSRFRDAYSDYKGTQKQFEVACRLLLKHNSRQRVHSSLLDDFVFHYTQTYPSYFAECHELGEEALPYGDFFDTVQPTHMKRIIDFTALERESGTNVAQPSKATASTNNLLASQGPKGNNPFQAAQESYGGSDAFWCITPAIASKADASLAREPALPGQDLTSSQHTSVQEWILATRGESPELGTPDIARSSKSPRSSLQATPAMSFKRSPPVDAEHLATIKRSKSNPTAAATTIAATVATVARTSQKHHASFATDTPSNNKTDRPANQAVAATPRSTPAGARSLPASFSAHRSMMDRTVSAPSAGTAVSATPSRPPRPPVTIRPFAYKVKRHAPSQKPAVPPASASPFVLPSKSAARLGEYWWKDENTPFKKFFSSWNKLYSEKSQDRTPAAQAGVNPYALADVTQWRK
ncbi:uncharacterized protein HMPREF1541_06441 [Cyphellophora europaea CBS 101466]|uniref:Uncharacterized protein n=1 Tax=Cyphellophora europaea (strain CBS 101466) TaxID=1220924 RepID=W2RPI1_CYPE1|nr:uncharacterized protein HMPREF1541_06441 [Cyphellophora europaea CBS 101466]ETN38406.1 hypothetical protein HMPREF1541_06441 [Cyphellophora europaea CBS 101466]